MLERLNYDNFKNLAIETALHTSATALICSSGLIAGSAMAVLSPSPSNLPSWAIGILSKTNNTALIYLSNHFNANYIVAPAVACAILPFVGTVFKSRNPSEEPNGNTFYRILVQTTALAILGSTVCNRLGYEMSGLGFLSKGILTPTIVPIAVCRLLDAAFPLPEKPEASETVTA